MLLSGEATAWLPTCDVISTRQWSYPVSALQTDLQAAARHFGRRERMA